MRSVLLFLVLSSAACERRAAVSALEAASRSAPPAPRPKAVPICSINLTAPDVYQRDFQGTDQCSASSGIGLAGDAVMNNSGPPHVIPAWLFESGNHAQVPIHDFHIGVDPAIAPGSTVTLTGDNTQPIVFMYWSGSSNSCFHFSGTATVVSQRPNLDVTFNLVCAEGGNTPLAGEFKSTL